MTKGEEQKARLRRIMGGVVAQLLVEMGTEDVNLSENLGEVFDAEPAADFEDMEGLTDDVLRDVCRKMAIATAPPEFAARMPAS